MGNITIASEMNSQVRVSKEGINSYKLPADAANGVSKDRVSIDNDAEGVVNSIKASYNSISEILNFFTTKFRMASQDTNFNEKKRNKFAATASECSGESSEFAQLAQAVSDSFKNAKTSQFYAKLEEQDKAMEEELNRLKGETQSQQETIASLEQRLKALEAENDANEGV